MRERKQRIWAYQAAVACVAAAMLTACGAKQPAGADNSVPEASAAQQPAGMTHERAKSIALADAGVSQSDTDFLWSKLDTEDGRSVYAVEFVADGIEYDYDIDAETGSILSSDSEAEHYRETFKAASSLENAQQDKVQSAALPQAEITEQQAKQAAFAHAGVEEKDVSAMKTKLETDDGGRYYEIEFYAGNTEYDYQIDAATGKVMSFDSEAELPAPRR